MDVEIIELELKYCERCGGLWLRARGSRKVYCNACVAAMEGPEATRKAKPRRLPVDGRLSLVKGEGSPTLWVEGGHA